jgi:ElaB/YqjD/DUF883 family membrane-anchored ribosome-binding protein
MTLEKAKQIVSEYLEAYDIVEKYEQELFQKRKDELDELIKKQGEIAKQQQDEVNNKYKFILKRGWAF